MADEVIQTVTDILPTVGLLLMLLVGLVIWLLGRRIARVACAISGLVLGGLAGFVLGESLSEQGAFVLPLVIGAALAGALLAGLLFRMWMGLSGAALLALAAPAAVLVWQGTPPDEPEPTPPTAAEAPATEEGEQPTSMTDLLRRSLVEEDTAVDEPEAEEQELADVEQVVEAAVAVARQWYDQQRERVTAWWSQLGPGTRGTIYIAGAIGAVVGLGLGLLLPFVAASFESALVGALLLLLAGRELTTMHASGATGLFPQSPRMVIVWVGLITVLGFAIQWTLFRRSADR